MPCNVRVSELWQDGFDYARPSIIHDVAKDRSMDKFKARVYIRPIDVRRADRVCEAIL